MKTLAGESKEEDEELEDAELGERSDVEEEEEEEEEEGWIPQRRRWMRKLASCRER